VGKHRLALLVGLAILIAIGGVVLLGGLGNNSSTGEVIAGGVPDTEEAQEIQATILQAYKLYDIAGRTFDASQFPSVFVNDPDVPLTRDQRERLQEWFGAVPENAGYLTYVIACYTDFTRGAKLFEEAMANARAKGRDYLTPDEWRRIVELHGGRPPAPRLQPSMTVEDAQEMQKTLMRYDLIDVEDDKARVIFDDGATLNKATLVRRGGKWYIAGVERLAVTGP